LLNKAIVCFKLNLINEYGDILEEVLKLDPNNKKAIYHKIKQLILQEHYDDAHNLLKERGALIDKETEKDIMKFLKI
jgi:Tfp pilus assembly protein PilF